jgi:hypothetical protein
MAGDFRSYGQCPLLENSAFLFGASAFGAGKAIFELLFHFAWKNNRKFHVLAAKLDPDFGVRGLHVPYFLCH